MIQEHDRRYPIRLMCRALAVSPAGYYAWRGRPESRRAAANRTLLVTIRVLHQDSRQTYGSPSIWRALRKQGHQVGEHRVARLMRSLVDQGVARLAGLVGQLDPGLARQIGGVVGMTLLAPLRLLALALVTHLVEDADPHVTEAVHPGVGSQWQGHSHQRGHRLATPGIW